MSKAQRDKGRRGELEVAARLADAGFEAVLLYGQEELGGGRGDVESLVGCFEVKRREGLPSWLRLRDEVRGVYVRRSRSPWLVLLRADDAERLMALERTAGAQATEGAAAESPAGECAQTRPGNWAIV